MVKSSLNRFLVALDSRAIEDQEYLILFDSTTSGRGKGLRTLISVSLKHTKAGPVQKDRACCHQVTVCRDLSALVVVIPEFAEVIVRKPWPCR